MGSDEKVLVHAADPQIAGRLAAAGFANATLHHGWLDLGDRPETVATQLSSTLGVPVVWWSIHTVVDQVWIRCFENGVCSRELRYASGERWTNLGTPRPFEAKAQLAKWLRKKRLAASPDGYDVLDAFLGYVPPEPVKSIREPNPTASYYLRELIVAEVTALAKERAVTASAILAAAWHLGKNEVYDRHLATDPTTVPAPTPPAEPPALAHEPRDVAPLAKPYEQTIECALALPDVVVREIAAMQRAFGEPAATLFGEAYVLARPRLI